MARSAIRLQIEKAIKKSGVKINTDDLTFTDRSKSGWRIKYCFQRLNEEELNAVRKKLRKQFKDNDVRVWNVNWSGDSMNRYYGVAIKIFN